MAFQLLVFVNRNIKQLHRTQLTLDNALTCYHSEIMNDTSLIHNCHIYYRIILPNNIVLKFHFPSRDIP